MLERECPMSLVRSVVEKHKHAEELWSRMVELDWPALAVPEDDGGLGLGFVELAVVCEQLGRVLCPAPFLATATQFVPAVLGGGEPRAATAASSARWRATASWDPGGGRGGRGASTPAGISTTATPDGDGFVLDGEKRFVFDADVADEIVVAARLPGTAGDDGIGLFVVPGASVDAEPMAGLDASRSYDRVVLDAVRVGPDRVLGEPGAAGAGPASAWSRRRPWRWRPRWWGRARRSSTSCTPMSKSASNSG